LNDVDDVIRTVSEMCRAKAEAEMSEVADVVMWG
jgi:hypothetical protein